MSCQCFECVGSIYEPTAQEYEAWLWWDEEIAVLYDLEEERKRKEYQE